MLQKNKNTVLENFKGKTTKIVLACLFKMARYGGRGEEAGQLWVLVCTLSDMYYELFL